MIIDVDIQEVKQEQEYSASPTSHRSTQSTLVYPTYDPRYNVSSSINYAPKDPRTPLLGYSTPVLLDHPRTRIQSRTMRALVATLLVGALTCGLLYKFTQNGSWKSVSRLHDITTPRCLTYLTQRTGRPSDDTIIVTTTPHSTSTSTTSHPSPTSTPREPNDDHSGTPLPKPSGSCLPSRLWRHHSGVASTTIRFPVDADVLRFDSVGPMTKGIVYFSTLPLGSPNFVGYEIIAYHPDPNILEKTQLCVQQGQNDGVYGATLYVRIVYCNQFLLDSEIDQDPSRTSPMNSLPMPLLAHSTSRCICLAQRCTSLAAHVIISDWKWICRSSGTRSSYQARSSSSSLWTFGQRGLESPCRYAVVLLLLTRCVLT
jgi:hypothetical protein